MTRLISQVLDLENFESGKHQLVIERVDIKQLIADCLKSLDGVFQQEQIIVATDIDESIPDLEIDYDRIVQVFLNILSNAAKYCEKGNGKVSVVARQTSSDVIIEISDNGPGVKEDMQEIIFEKFFQAKNQTMRKPKGSGLGLAISKKIIQLHEGKIGVSSGSPKGSVFTFSLPKPKNFI